jgi:hypothetical protein
MEEAGKHCTLPLLRTSPPCPADGEERPLLPHIVRVIPLPKCTETARLLHTRHEWQFGRHNVYRNSVHKRTSHW